MPSVISPKYFTSSPSFDETTTTIKQVENNNPTLEEKREIIKHQLKNNYPVKTVLTFGITFVAMGFASIGLDVTLIVSRAVNYQLGNGIWAGCAAIFNGLLKLNQARTRGYASHVISQVISPYLGVLTSIGLTMLSSITLRQYECPSPDCVPRDLAVILTMLVMGVVNIVLNIAFVFVFSNLLLGSRAKAKVQRLGFIDAYRELNYILKN